MGEQVVIDISRAGVVTIDAQGYQGTSCANATEQLELVLGGGAKKRETKPEYHMPAGQHGNNKLTF